MDIQKKIDYSRVAEAIDYINEHFKEQPSLEKIAEKVHLSPFHFQRLFSEWAGTSPKKFLQYISIQHAKKLLEEKQASLFDVAYETGLSGPGRLHDLFINIEGMTPAEYKNGGKGLLISFNYADSPFGNILVASTQKGVCYMVFIDDQEEAFLRMQKHFPNATYTQELNPIHQSALRIFTDDPDELNQIKLHLKGTDFQLKVWEALLKIPMGQLSTYGRVAATIESPNASRAVGTAIGSNPVAFLIPCHRVIQSTGVFGGYMWGSTRKAAIIGWESAKTSSLK